MYINDSDLDFLLGKKFSTGHKIRFNNFTKCETKTELLVDKVRNLNIIHMGFLDHLPVIDKKIKEKKWLHEYIDNSSKHCLGLDIDLEGIKYIKNNYPQYNVLYYDIYSYEIPNEITSLKWDYIIIPDVIEHINNPVYFLNEIKNKLSKYCNSLIITTPNATRLNNIINTFKNIEHINTDHRFWFTPYTISKIVIDSKSKIKSLDLIEYGELPKRNFIKKYLLNKYPLLRDTIVIEIDLK